jgi:hypothetical protein
MPGSFFVLSRRYSRLGRSEFAAGRVDAEAHCRVVRGPRFAG